MNTYNVPLLKAYHTYLERERNDANSDTDVIAIFERAIADVTKFLESGDPEDLSDDVSWSGHMLSETDIPGGWQRWNENAHQRVERERAAKKAARSARRARG